ncbi:hypothetical protein G9464_20365 [Halostella sp. JP-L12]|uniref:hypothetical protein n=1 Tax=Halostella TaxID=1843185 RepID=UPI000EF7E530|nr:MULTISPECIES: hypothetical protein [Halostella]NHN49927.1 hypothetical protein [Halostella sp. JP-L12]
MDATTRRRYRSVAAATVVALVAFSGRALAHGGALRESSGDLSVPTWLFLATGGGAVGASFLLASLVTDRALIRRIDEYGSTLGVSRSRVLSALGSVVGVVGLTAVLWFGFRGPVDPFRNLAVLVVWVGWWAGYVMSVYLVGDTWPAVNPFRTVVELLPSLGLDYPERLGAWPSVAGLVALIWVEVVSPLADEPRLLARVVAAYTVVTVVGGVLFGAERWFSTVDPVSRVFDYYGRVAPVARTDDGLELRLPGMALTEARGVTGADEVAFVVAVLWVTTYDGLVTTPAWGDAARWLVEAGLPPMAVYVVALLGGFGLFYGSYVAASRASRGIADTYLTAGMLARRFAPPLLAIAAGYHLAHFLGYFVRLSLPLASALAAPFSPPDAQLFVLPSWFGGVELAFVLIGHLVAIWVAHATAYDVFPSRLQAVRSQYPFILVMVVYTMVSMWIVAEPSATPPYL